MLVLSRKENESILVGTDIVVSVVRIESGKVRIGIKAPQEIVIERSELRFKDGYVPKKAK